MCTLAWGVDKEQLWACFNRDALRSRPEAEKPELLGEPGRRIAYSRDPTGKGTWLAVSECGYMVALLNNYPDEEGLREIHLKSRGQLVLQIASQESPMAADRLLKQLPLGIFAPFHLFILSNEESIGCSWNGISLEQLDCPGKFWSSSSHLQDKVVLSRKSYWEKHGAGKVEDAAAAGKIMQECSPVNPAYGLTMDRDDARTVSQIRVQMGASGFVFEYLGRQKNDTGYLEPITLYCPPRV